MSGVQVASAVVDSLVDEGHVKELLDVFTKTKYRACDKDSKLEIVERRCLHLFAKDYKYSVIYNGNGELCNHYPTKVILLEYALPNSENIPERVESLYDLEKIQDLFTKSRFARCRSRFVVPVILYEGKHICRSATLSSGAEIYGRSGYDYFFTGGNGLPDEDRDQDNDVEQPHSSGDWQLFDRIRGQDIKLLKTMSVGYICDLMVEHKKVKYGLNVTSSEKADKEHRYSQFCLMSLPYPGCEFFRDYKDKSYVGEGLMFDWEQAFVDAELLIPNRCKQEKLGIDWTKYRSWDLVTITQNYLKLLLHILKEGDSSGLLVHCISGWDRTPLFVSLLRLSLWADGKIHQKLSPVEILYLTVAYDWLLFGHNLVDRVAKGEEIFFFCFNFLKEITSEDFSINQQNHRSIGRYDSDQFDHLLLDPDDLNRQRCDSTTSLNSASSITSVSSNSSPIVFNVLERPDDDEQINMSGFSASSSSTTTIIYKPYNNSNGNATEVSDGRVGTSPMAVPKSHRKCSTDASNCKSATSSDCGSWQMISRTESCKDFVSSCSCTTDTSNGSSSCMTDTSHCSNSSTANNSSSAPEVSSRHQKLSEVRKIFITQYGDVVGYKNGYGSDAGMLGYLVDNLKGIKSRLF